MNSGCDRVQVPPSQIHLYLQQQQPAWPKTSAEGGDRKVGGVLRQAEPS